MKFIKEKISISEALSATDWGVFFFLLCLTLGFVFYGEFRKRRLKKSEKFDLLDHLIMGRRLTLPLFIATLVATWYGGIFGVTQIAFNKGIYNFITQGLFWYIAYIIFALFLVERIVSYKAVTLPDLVGKMFGPKSSKVAAVLNFFNVLPIAYVISLGIFIRSFTSLELNTSMILGLVIVLSYSVWGGLRSVIFSDIIQFFIMCIAVGLVLFFSIGEFGGLGFLKEKLPEHYFSVTSDQSYFQLFVWGFIALSTLVDPNFYQRCFAATDSKVAKKGIFLSTLIWFCFDICTTFGAMYAKAVIPEALSSEAYLIYSIQVLPEGLRGFFLAGILATILSTLDSYLFLAGTTLTYDLSNEDHHENPFFHCIGILFVGAISLLMANFFSGNIKMVWKTLGSYSAGCLLFPVLLGHFSKTKFSDNAFVATCLVSAALMSVWSAIPRSGLLSDVDSLYIGIAASFIGLYGFNYYFARQKSDNSQSINRHL